MLLSSVVLLDLIKVYENKFFFKYHQINFTVLEFYSTNQMFGDGGRPIFYSLQCSGCESHIIACSKTAYPHIYCNKGSVAGVRCNHGNIIIFLNVKIMMNMYRLY